jgi:hypothetical protein
MISKVSTSTTTFIANVSLESSQLWQSKMRFRMEKLQSSQMPRLLAQRCRNARFLSGHSNGAGIDLMRTRLTECPSENHHAYYQTVNNKRFQRARLQIAYEESYYKIPRDS